MIQLSVSEMIKLKGVGRWTSDIYLLMALRRPNIWPGGDLALAVAIQEVKRLQTRPSTEEMDSISKSWEPWKGRRRQGSVASLPERPPQKVRQASFAPTTR